MSFIGKKIVYRNEIYTIVSAETEDRWWCLADGADAPILLDEVVDFGFGYVFHGLAQETEGEVSFYPCISNAKDVFDSLCESCPNDSVAYGIARWDETANNVLTPMEVWGFINI